MNNVVRFSLNVSLTKNVLNGRKVGHDLVVRTDRDD